MVNTIKIEEIENILIPVSEEILSSSLPDFLITSLKNANIEINSEHKIFYSYLSTSKYYQISTFKSTSKSVLLELELISHLLENNSYTFELCVVNNYFILYKNRILYYYQKIGSDIPSFELKDFLERKFLITIDKKYTFTQDDINNISSNYNQNNYKTQILYINQNKTFGINSKKIAYVLLVIFVLTFMFYDDGVQNSKQESRLVQIQEDYQDLKNSISYKKYISIKLLNIFIHIKNNNLILHKLDLEDGKISLIIKAINKELLYDFIRIYQASTINSIIKNKEYYEMDAKISF